jgi:putative endonuclease
MNSMVVKLTGVRGKMAYRQRLGSWGENLAESYFIQRGWVPLLRNYRTRYGEIDLVMKDQEMIVFVEVKTRSNLDFGTPEESITRKKKQRMLHSAAACLQDHPEWGGYYRIDVLAVIGSPADASPEIIWFENAVG